MKGIKEKEREIKEEDGEREEERGVDLSLIHFLCPLLFYSTILINFSYYSPQHANYSPIILISNPHLLVHNENNKVVLCLPRMMHYIHGLKSAQVKNNIVSEQCAH